MYKIQRAAVQCYKCIVSMYACMCVGMHQWNAMNLVQCNEGSCIAVVVRWYCSGWYGMLRHGLEPYCVVWYVMYRNAVPCKVVPVLHVMWKYLCCL